MVSDDEGHLFGSLEDGKQIPLSVPHPDAVVGISKWENSVDLAMKDAKNQLRDRARIDSGRYYFISEGHPENDGYVLPYVTFEK